jgi:hypothetical protein
MKIKFLILFLGISMKLLCQNNIDGFKTMTDSAIIIKLKAEYEHYNQELKKDIKTENWNIYMSDFKNRLENIYLTDNNYNAFYLDNNRNASFDFKSLDVYKKENKKLLRKGLHVWKVKSILDNNRITIFIIDFVVTYRKGEYDFANGGGSTTVFEYDCNETRWNLIKTSISGI